MQGPIMLLLFFFFHFCCCCCCCWWWWWIIIVFIYISINSWALFLSLLIYIMFIRWNWISKKKKKKIIEYIVGKQIISLIIIIIIIINNHSGKWWWYPVKWNIDINDENLIELNGKIRWLVDWCWEKQNKKNKKKGDRTGFHRHILDLVLFLLLLLLFYRTKKKSTDWLIHVCVVVDVIERWTFMLLFFTFNPRKEREKKYCVKWNLSFFFE